VSKNLVICVDTSRMLDGKIINYYYVYNMILCYTTYGLYYFFFVSEAYRWILPGVLLSGVLSQCTATVQLYVKLVVIPTCAVDVNAIRVVRISGRVQQTAEGTVETDANFHIIILALSFNVCEED